MSTPYLPTAGVPSDPQWNGIYAAQVAVTADPLNVSRVRLFIPQVLGTAQSNWATPMQPGITPAAGTTCLATFLGGDINKPYYFLGVNASIIEAASGNQAVLNSNAFFTGNQLTGWTASNGTLTALAPNKATNPPFPNAALWTGAGPGGGYIQESAAKFTAVIGQPYLVQAWVYYPLGGNVNIGSAWTGQATTVTSNSVPAGTWTYISTVVTATATTGFPLVGPATSLAGQLFMAEAVTVTGQIPGQIISAGSISQGQVNFSARQIGGITTTIAASAPGGALASDLWFNSSAGYTLYQYNGSTWTPYQFGTGSIAAGSITAAQIAASTITAAQIAAGTITAAKIQAGIILAGAVNGTTITGATIVADGLSGQFLIYSGAPQTGNLIGSWSGVAGTDTHGNMYPAGLSVQQGVITGLDIDSTTITNSTFQGDVVANSTITNPSITGGFATETVITFDQTGGQLLVYASSATTITQNTPGTYTFSVPSTTTSAKIECWAAGQGGDGGKTSLGGSAGNGGSYACEPTYGLVSSSTVTYIVGAKGAGGGTGTSSHGGNGGDSLFGGVNGVHAIGGGNQANYGPFNSVNFTGGAGGPASGFSGGASGGNSGTPTTNGNNGIGSTGSGGAPAPTIQTNSGRGAPGGASGSNANTAASTPGGGGGGAGQGSSNNSSFTYFPNWTGSYFGPDASSGANNLRSSDTLYQGKSSRGGGNTSGNQRAIMEFPVFQINSDMGGLTPFAAYLVINNQNTAYGAGMIIELSYDSTNTLGSSQLGSYPTGDTMTHLLDWFVPNGATVTIPLGGALAVALANESVDSIIIGAHVAATYPGIQDWQGYFDGTSVQLVVQGSPGSGTKIGSLGGAGQVQITYTSGQVLVAAISPQAGTDKYGNTFVVGGSFENVQLYGAATPATPPANSSILYSSSIGSPSCITDTGFTGQLAVTQCDVTTFTNTTAGSFANISKAWPIPANNGNANTCYRLHVWGIAHISTAAASLAWQIVAFGTNNEVELTGSALPGGGVAALYWEVEAQATVVTSGSSGSVLLAIRANANISPLSFGSATPNSWVGVAVGNTVTANTTLATTCVLQGMWTASAGTSPSTQGVTSTFERIGP